VLITAAPLVVLTALPLPLPAYGAAAAPIGSFAFPPGYVMDLVIPLLASTALRVVVPLAIVLFLFAMTGVPSYFFHPPHLTVVQQNRAIALSYYACAPIVLLLPAGIAGCALVAGGVAKPDLSRDYFFAWAFMVLATGALSVAAVLLTWWSSLRLLRQVTACSTARVLTLAVTLPVAWALLAALILVGVPWVAGFALLVVWSFQ